MNKNANAETSLVTEQWDPFCYWNACVPDKDTRCWKTYVGSIARDANA